MLVLHHFPGTAAMTPHMLLRHIGAPFRLEPVDRDNNGHKQPDAIVVGLPLNMDGTPSDMSERAEKFARRLNGRFNLPVFTHDERLTTFEAKGQRLAQGQRGGYRDNPVDALAAALLLEGWLAEHPGHE